MAPIRNRVGLDQLLRVSFSTMRLGRHYNNFFREGLDVLPLEVLEARLDGSLNNLIQIKVSVSIAGGWNQLVFKISSNPNHSDSQTTGLINICYSLREVIHSIAIYFSPTQQNQICSRESQKIQKKVTIYQKEQKSTGATVWFFFSWHHHNSP